MQLVDAGVAEAELGLVLSRFLFDDSQNRLDAGRVVDLRFYIQSTDRGTRRSISEKLVDQQVDVGLLSFENGSR